MDDLDQRIAERQRLLNERLDAKRLEQITPPEPSRLRSSLRVGFGALGGGIGAGFGAAAGGIGAIPGGLAGAGLGAAGGGTLANLIEGPTSNTFAGQAADLGKQAFTGVESEMLGQGLGAGITRGARSLLSRPLDAAAAGMKALGERLNVPLRAGDITQSAGMKRIETFPSYMAIGAGPVQKFTDQQLGAMDRATLDTLKQFPQNVDKIAAGIDATKDIRQGLSQWRVVQDRVWKGIERMTGDEAVVPTEPIKNFLNTLSQQPRTPIAPPGALGRMAETVGAGQSKVSVGGQTVDLAALPPQLRDMLEEASRVDAIPFGLARRISSELAQLGRGPNAIASIDKGMLWGARKAMNEGIEIFLQSPAGAQVNPALEEAKQSYRVGRQLWNESIVRGVARYDKPMQAGKVVDTVFRPGQIEDTLDFKQAVSDQTYLKATSSWLNSVYEKAKIGDDQFSPVKFASQMQPYLKSGHLDVILPPETASRVKELVRIFETVGPRAEQGSGIRSVPGAVLTMGQMMGLLYSVMTASPKRAALALAPYGLAKATTTDTGIKFLSEGLKPSTFDFGAAILGVPGRMASQAAGQAMTE